MIKQKIQSSIKKMYIVKYCGGSYEDYYEKIVFVTDKKSTATKYVTKFNKTLKKWKDYYSQYEEKSQFGVTWIKDSFNNKFNRWYSLGNISRAYWEEVEVR